MKIGIVTDSTSDLPAYLVEEYNIQVVPTILVIGGREYLDGTGISREDFYVRLPALKTPPTTAAPSIGNFTASYETLFSQGCDHIISIHSASQLTSIVNVARQAAQAFPNKVTCIDSGSLTMGLGFQVVAAAEEAEFGLNAALDAITSTRKQLRINAVLDTMEYLRRSGRVPATVAALGGMLSIKPMIELLEGQVKPIGAVRTTSEADERILNFLLAKGDLQRLAILHTNAEHRARKLLDERMSRTPQSVPRDVMFGNVTAVIGTHLGPNGVGFAAVMKK